MEPQRKENVAGGGGERGLKVGWYFFESRVRRRQNSRSHWMPVLMISMTPLIVSVISQLLGQVPEMLVYYPLPDPSEAGTIILIFQMRKLSHREVK